MVSPTQRTVGFGSSFIFDCEKRGRLLPARSLRRGTAVPRARSTQVERALRTRFGCRCRAVMESPLVVEF
jgi:hypothetical protein